VRFGDGCCKSARFSLPPFLASRECEARSLSLGACGLSRTISQQNRRTIARTNGYDFLARSTRALPKRQKRPKSVSASIDGSTSTPRLISSECRTNACSTPGDPSKQPFQHIAV
jgi:hypothetical protein